MLNGAHAHIHVFWYVWIECISSTDAVIEKDKIKYWMANPILISYNKKDRICHLLKHDEMHAYLDKSYKINILRVSAYCIKEKVT